ncbi:MAG: nicotinamide mononucleotide transporter [Ruminococcaceae bacterium]|nr:nicotinamide mononucleotide transporter [Oscillospiraceae bacterium]
MNIIQSVKSLTKFEKILWLSSVAVVLSTFFIFKSEDYLTLIASLIGVTALIFLAKGHSIGQILIIVFALFYGYISYHFRYYGEMITYLGMTVPMAVVALVSWLRHPYKETAEVEISKLSKKQVVPMLIFTVLVTVAFYFILKALGNASLLVSTVSVTTSFLAAYLTALRSPYFALGYAMNDLVLVCLWIIAVKEDISSLSMVACFVTFFINDMYGFVSWKRMEKRQKKSPSC